MGLLDEEELFARARQGDGVALGVLLERCRPWLRQLAQRELDSQLKARVDPSDVIQQTFLEATRDIGGFQGEVEEQLFAWLRRILTHNVAEVVQRHLVAGKRTLRKERVLAASAGEHSTLQPELAGEDSTPSQRAIKQEELTQLEQAIEALPEGQREAVRLRHVEGWPLRRIAEHLGRSEPATAGLVKRGLRTLKERLPAVSAAPRETPAGQGQ